jgi:hypothetical protein
MSPDQLRALSILADFPVGCPETLMRAHGFSEGCLCGLIDEGFAAVTVKRMMAGGKGIKVTCIHVTDAGRQALK